MPMQASRYPEFDPSFSAIDGAFAAAMNAYVRGELKFEDDLPYEILNHAGPWSFGPRNASQEVWRRQFASEMNEIRVSACWCSMADAIWRAPSTVFATTSTICSLIRPIAATSLTPNTQAGT